MTGGYENHTVLRPEAQVGPAVSQKLAAVIFVLPVESLVGCISSNRGSCAPSASCAITQS
jgi:hypothetical protein